MKKFYVVWVGRTPGVFDNWDDARESVENYKGARYKAYSSSGEAAEAYRKGLLLDEKINLGAFLRQVSQEKLSATPDWRGFVEVDRNAWAVDASCMGNPGVMEYQGVDLSTGRVIFRIGPFKDATNNIGEYLAIVHAMALMENRGERHTIYSDSRTGMSWVRRGAANTKLKATAANKEVRELIRRADHWLGSHQFRVPVLKWDTDRWGEIPADFGRKK
ncbi:MAG: ribonuclease H family protein [Prevotella sp.]|nr:ribonuclease H family protein [Bacteroides sp.]MCM1366237.1 ribonuclease H family protein [Prevotella sp.]MCM1436358.1 ribonuclease H family protein [Prevotella sp.]